jgi:tetratricopeptide (TPR) repeat protein
LEAEPRDVQALLHRGAAHEALKSYKQAIGDFAAAIKVDPSAATADMYYSLGRACILDNDFDSGIANLTKAIEMDPNRGLAYANRGVAYRNKGEYSRAVGDFRKALGLLKKPSRIATVQRLLEEAETLAKQSLTQGIVEVQPESLPGTEPPREDRKLFW